MKTSALKKEKQFQVVSNEMVVIAKPRKIRVSTTMKEC